MAHQTVYDTLLEISGSHDALREFSRRHLANSRFSLDSLDPVPDALKYEMSNLVEDGYDAMYGDWTKLARRWMFKDVADERGFPFPLESREHILECFHAFGEVGEQYFPLGERFHSNLERYGHGHERTWCQEHWGMDYDVEESLVEMLPDVTRIAFSSQGSVPPKTLKLLSQAHPELTFSISSISEMGRRGKKLDMRNGKQVKKYSLPDEEIRDAIWGFRRDVDFRLLASVSNSAEWIDEVEMSERGRPTLKSTRFSLGFMMYRLEQGETVEHLVGRFPALTEKHIKMIRSLALQGRPAIIDLS
ncbi:MAG TPA: hypothetical protein VIU46_09825 [Gallionellaceae bacterium]